MKKITDQPKLGKYPLYDLVGGLVFWACMIWLFFLWAISD